MQDAKNFAFLMHPTHTTNATEGSRLALGHEGGCIKKAPAETGASRRNGEENLGCHGSGRLGGLGFAGGLGQLGPDSEPGALAEHLPRELPFGGVLNAARFGRVHVTPSGQALVQVLLMHAHLGGERTAEFWSDLAGHEEPFCRNASSLSSVMTEAEC